MNALRSWRFAVDDVVKEAVHDWLRSQPQTFFSNGIKKLTDRWAKCMEKKGDCFEKKRCSDGCNLNKDFLKYKVRKLFEILS